MISPVSRAKNTWDWLLVVLLVAVIIKVPYQVVLHEVRFDAFYWLVTAVLSADVLVRFNTGFHQLQTLVTDRKEIARRYLRSWFAVDLICALPLGPLLIPILGGTTPDGLAEALLLLRFFTVIRLPHLLAGLERTLPANPAIMRLANFVFWFALMAHVMALGWIALGAAARIDQDLGIILQLSDPVPHAERYVRALYFVTTTMATIGYGDIVPHKNDMGELIYTICLQITGAGMYGYVIGSVSSLLANLDVARANFRRHMEEVNIFMRSKRLPAELQAKVRNYFDYVWESRQSTGMDNTLDRMPARLALDIRLFLTRDILQKVPFFRQADEAFIRDIVAKLEDHVFLPGEYLMRHGEYGDCMYFVNSGEMEILLRENQVVARVGPGSHVGEMSLLCSGKRNASVRAMTFCEVHGLSKANFDAIRNRHPAFDAQIREEIARRENADTP